MYRANVTLVGALLLFVALGVAAAQAPITDPGGGRPSPKPKPKPTAPAPRPALVGALPERAHRYAVVVGVGAYDDTTITGQPGAALDATSVAETLVRYGDFSDGQVALLVTGGAADRLPTRERIVAALSALKLPEDALLFVYFSGQTIDRDNRLLLLPADARSSGDASALSGEELGDLVRATGAEQAIVILDGWRNDGSVEGPPQSVVGQAASRAVKLGGGNLKAYAIFYPATRGQGAYFGSTAGRTYFGIALVEALGGEAADEQGEVTLGRLADFLKRRVAERVRDDYERQQTPAADLVGYRGDVVLVSGVHPTAAVEAIPTVVGPGAEGFEQGQAALKAGNPEAAIAAFQDAIAKQPDSPVLYRRLSFAFQVSRKYEDAVRALQSAINLAPEDADAMQELGYLLYSQMGDPERAFVVLEHVLELKPTPKLKSDLALVYLAAGAKRFEARNFMGAIQAYERAGALAPQVGERVRTDMARAYCRIGQERLAENKPADASTAYAKAVEIDASAVDGYLGLARSYARAGDFAAATAVVERLRPIDPDWAARLETEINGLKKN